MFQSTFIIILVGNQQNAPPHKNEEVGVTIIGNICKKLGSVYFLFAIFIINCK